MANVDSYLQLAERPNTRRSYAAAVRHFETQWRGLLPATPELVAEYLADFAGTLSVNTLQARLAGLSRWHKDFGFQDPTKSVLVQRVLKGIRTAHNTQEKQARPVEFDRLEHVSAWLELELLRFTGAEEDDGAERLRRARDRAMLLIGFWRGFRADELTRLSFEHITVRPGIGMTCFIPHSKTDRSAAGRTFQCPVLSKLCPVTAYEQWKQASGLSAGPVFRRIDRWGHVSTGAMTPGSVVPWLRELFRAAGVEEADSYSSHSLRRGFANWAKSSGWNIKELMEYVGWNDVNSALRYLDRTEDGLSARFEAGLSGAASNASAPGGRIRGSGDAGSPGGTNVVQLPLRPTR